VLAVVALYFAEFLKTMAESVSEPCFFTVRGRPDGVSPFTCASQHEYSVLCSLLAIWWISVGNNIMDYFFDEVNRFVEPISRVELAVRESIPNNEKLLEEEHISLTTWMNSPQ
jgi:hypothetical protein